MSSSLQLISQKARSFAEQSCNHLIDGVWKSSTSKKNFDVFDPSDGSKFTNAALGGEEEIDAAVRAARKAFHSGPWPTMSPSDRGKLLWRIAELIDEHADILAELESLDNGKPYSLARHGDIVRAAETFRYYAGFTTKHDGRAVNIAHAQNNMYNASVRFEPIGVAGQIIPWNVPLVMAAWKLAPALAVGCTTVLKPAEQTPLTATFLGQLLLKANLPSGVVNIVHGDKTTGALLLNHEGIDKIAFTGSSEVGKLILKTCASSLKKVSLELGGKSPHIIFADADLEKAIPIAARGIFGNCGQSCSAGSRLFIERSVFDQVVDGIRKIAQGMRMGPGMLEGVDLGPVVSIEQMERVQGFIERGQKEGATVVCGGTPHPGKGFFVEPTIFKDTTKEMSIRREEIFGPVLCAIPFDDEEAMILDANDTPYGLASGIWTTNLSRAHRLSARLRTGSVYVNCYQVSDVNLPFGGYKQSGFGRELGPEALTLYTETKSVCIGL